MVFLYKLPFMVIFPRAKINLGLRVIEKRGDGYHNIETVFYPVGLSDALEIVVAQDGMERDLLEVTGLPTGGDAEDNLVTRAVRLLRDEHPIPFLRIHLHKMIPPGAGLGGGSSDAASAIKALNRCFRLGLSNESMREYALRLGSDLPFFIDCQPSHASGRGELLSPAPEYLKGCYIILANPGIHVSTAEAYKNCIPSGAGGSLDIIDRLPLTEWKDHILNDFEDYVFRIHPEIGGIKDIMYGSGAVFSLMSGSGSTVYGIFSSETPVPSALRPFVIFSGYA